MLVKALEERVAICAIHGEYTEKVRLLLGRTIRTKCPKCSQEERIAEEQKRKREQAKDNWEHLLKESNIPLRYREKRLANYKAIGKEQQAGLDAVQEYILGWKENRKKGASLIFIGTPGTGKTHLAVSCALELMEQGSCIYYVEASDIFKRIKATYDKMAGESEIAVYKAMAEPDVLVIDEIGRQRGTDSEKLALFEIINDRYNQCKPMFLISNGSGSTLKDYITDAGFDRLKEIGRSIVLNGESVRGKI